MDKMIRISTEVHNRLKIEAAKRQTSMKDLAEKAIRNIIKDTEQMKTKTVYQYWQHRRSGETYAVMIEDGEPRWICGPLHYKEYEQREPGEYNFDDRFGGDPDDYELAVI